MSTFSDYDEFEEVKYDFRRFGSLARKLGEEFGFLRACPCFKANLFKKHNSFILALKVSLVIIILLLLFNA